MSRKRKQRQEQASNIDFRALDAIAEPLGQISWHGRLVPLLRPVGEVDDHMLFDCAVCATGMKEFLREILPSDSPACRTLVEGSSAAVAEMIEETKKFRYVLVSEITPGTRSRLLMNIQALDPERN